jgi:hypothetical protein
VNIEDGFPLLDESLFLSDFNPTKTNTSARYIKKMDDYSEEDEAENTNDCYVDLYTPNPNTLQPSNTPLIHPRTNSSFRCKYRLCATSSNERKYSVKWFMDARLIKEEMMWKLRDPTEPKTIQTHEFEIHGED